MFELDAVPHWAVIVIVCDVVVFTVVVVVLTIGTVWFPVPESSTFPWAKRVPLPPVVLQVIMASNSNRAFVSLCMACVPVVSTTVDPSFTLIVRFGFDTLE